MLRKTLKFFTSPVEKYVKTVTVSESWTNQSDITFLWLWVSRLCDHQTDSSVWWSRKCETQSHRKVTSYWFVQLSDIPRSANEHYTARIDYNQDLFIYLKTIIIYRDLRLHGETEPFEYSLLCHNSNADAAILKNNYVT